jgi:hypothetical protein
MKSAFLYIVAGPYQAVRWQQEPKELYSVSTPTVYYKISLYSHEKCTSVHCCRSLSGCTVKAGIWIALQPLYTYSNL